MKKALFMVALIALSFALVGCGSSGSSSCDDSGGGSQVITKKFGCVSGAPVKGAQVFAKSTCKVVDNEKINCGGRDILIGVTDENGCIILDEEAFKKLDRSQNIFLYSKGGVRFNCAYSCEKDVKLKGASERNCCFKGQMRAVLAPGECKAYLTLPNTIVHDLVKCGETLEDARNLVKKLICCLMSIKTMADPLGNACCELVNYEYIAQALLIGMGSCEEGLATNSPRYQRALRRAVNNIKNWENLESYRFIPVEEVKGAMIPVLGPKYRAEIECLTRQDVICDNVYTLELKALDFRPKCRNNRCDDCCFIPFYGDPPVFSFTVKPITNKIGKKGQFVVAELPEEGKLFARGEEVKVGDEFTGEERFRYVLNDVEYEHACGQKVLFTFKAKDGCFVSPLIVCARYLKRGESVVTEFERFEACKNTKFFVEPVRQGATLDTSNPTVIKVVNGLYAKVIDAELQTLLTFKIDGLGVLRAGQELTVEVTAPEGFVFKYTDSATLPFRNRTDIPISGNTFSSTFVYQTDKNVSDLSPLELIQDSEIGMVMLRTTENPQDVQRSNIAASIYFDDELKASCGDEDPDNDPDENSCGCDFVILAKGSGPEPCIPDTISIPENFEDFLRGQGVIGTPGAGPSENAPTRILITINPIGGTCDNDFVFNPDEWTAVVVNPDPPQNPVQTGFGTGPYTVEVPLATFNPAPQVRGTFGQLANGKPIPTVWAVFKAQPFNLGADAPFIVRPGPDNHYADILFRYTKGTYVRETNTFRIFEKNPQSNP
ncbi:hypothetical protein [Halodesulfovibrio sp.]|jgi:hypothetical protein|uniref:hypothetical protein n=1 Tax=Halodesulfovibrio sp. TaxID=1912772 RepID=UPI0025CD4DCB|nr:hypothetical protein [Halodesulfovibrio sp.]MCT4534808.1 hypothetical protein [Halodesulfovibrio sp.]